MSTLTGANVNINTGLNVNFGALVVRPQADMGSRTSPRVINFTTPTSTFQVVGNKIFAGCVAPPLALGYTATFIPPSELASLTTANAQLVSNPGPSSVGPPVYNADGSVTVDIGSGQQVFWVISFI
jgi:hypothetical protein